MKNIIRKISIILMCVIMYIITNKVYGASAGISASKTYAYVGESVTISVNVNAAAWNLSVSGSGISGGYITGFNNQGTNENTTKAYILNTGSVGTYVITLKGDISDGETDVTSDILKTVTVVVKEKPVVVTPTEPSTQTTPNTNSNSTKPSSNTGNSKPTLSSNANLKEFRIDQPSISPEFNKNIYNYSVSVAEDVDNINVTAVPEDNRASVSISGNTNLKLGENVINVKVTAQDKKTINTYKIVVNKSDNPEKSDAYLQSLYVEDLILNPEFSKENFSYKLGNIDESINSLKITAFPVNQNAKVEIIGNENLAAGENNIKIIVTSENGMIENTYVLTLNKITETSSLKQTKTDNYSSGSYIWIALKENAVVILLYFFVWVEFLQVVYLYERLKKVESVTDKEKEDKK